MFQVLGHVLVCKIGLLKLGGEIMIERGHDQSYTQRF